MDRSRHTRQSRKMPDCRSATINSDTQRQSSGSKKTLRTSTIDTIMTSLPAAASKLDCRHSHPDCRATLVVPAPQFRPQTFPIATLGGHSVELSDSLSNMTRPLTTVAAAISARLDLLKRALISPPSESGTSREDQAASKTACAVRASDCRQCRSPQNAAGAASRRQGHLKGTIFRYRHANVLADVSS
jgi:hypothetical protein